METVTVGQAKKLDILGCAIMDWKNGWLKENCESSAQHTVGCQYAKFFSNFKYQFKDFGKSSVGKSENWES